MCHCAALHCCLVVLLIGMKTYCLVLMMLTINAANYNAYDDDDDDDDLVVVAIADHF